MMMMTMVMMMMMVMIVMVIKDKDDNKINECRKSKGMQCLLLSLRPRLMSQPLDKNEQFACFSTMTMMMI